MKLMIFQQNQVRNKKVEKRGVCFLIAHYPFDFQTFLIFGVSKRKKLRSFFWSCENKNLEELRQLFLPFFCWRAKFLNCVSFLKMRRKIIEALATFIFWRRGEIALAFSPTLTAQVPSESVRLVMCALAHVTSARTLLFGKK